MLSALLFSFGVYAHFLLLLFFSLPALVSSRLVSYECIIGKIVLIIREHGECVYAMWQFLLCRTSLYIVIYCCDDDDVGISYTIANNSVWYSQSSHSMKIKSILSCFWFGRLPPPKIDAFTKNHSLSPEKQLNANFAKIFERIYSKNVLIISFFHRSN